MKLTLNDCKDALEQAKTLCDIGDTAGILRWLERAKAIVQVCGRQTTHVPTVHREPTLFSRCPAENCVICRKPTRTWLTPHIPLCSDCAAQPIYRCRACGHYWTEGQTLLAPEFTATVRTCHDAMCGGTCDLQRPATEDETPRTS